MKNFDLKIFAKTVEEEAMSQIMSMASHKAMEGTKIRIMPDTHAGKGCTIGTSYNITDYLCPSHVGVDIGCSVTLIRTTLKANPSDYETIERMIKKSVPMGFKIHDKIQYNEKQFRAFLKSEYNKAISAWPEQILPGMDFTEKGLAAFCNRVGIDVSMFYRSIGSVGGGNHYIELGVSKHGDYTISFHFGSRNLGVKVCKYWESKANKGGVSSEELKRRIEEFKKNVADNTKIKDGIERIKAELNAKAAPTGFLSGLDMRGYLTDMVIAQAYAKYNHKVIGDIILNLLRNKFGGFSTHTIYTTHNYINTQDHILRKGAVSAKEGEMFVLPFNMRDGMALCVGKGNEDWNCTAPHGAGRLMSRSAAKKNLDMEMFKNEMDGIVSTSVCESTIDESPMAYKPMDEIVELIKPTCEIIEFIKPIINIKATDGVND